MAIVLVAVAGLSIVALTGLNDRRSSQEHFVAVVRNDHPSLSPAVVSDAELIAMARRSCAPNGPTGTDQRTLATLGIDVAVFRREASPLCPQR